MSRKTLVVPLLVAALGGCGESRAPVGSPQPEPVETTAARTTAAPPEAPTQAPPAVDVLRAWDARRAVAWSHGDLAALAVLYTRGSVAGRHDREMLRAWVSRGLTVRGLRTQLLAVREVSHAGSTWTLRVTDRLVGGVAVGGGVRRTLPRDEATTRTVRLRLVDRAWRVASARPEEVTPQAD